MFTGIIEELGKIRAIHKGPSTYQLTIEALKIREDLSLGDSVAVNGVCLTAEALGEKSFAAQVMPETMRQTGLGELQTGSPVNLERALPANGRLGGHLVSGHIDGTGKIASIQQEGNAVWLSITAKPELTNLLLERGSVAVDGVSLTVAQLKDGSFKVSLIPHTAKETILLTKKPGQTVNLECDMIGKYVQKFLNLKPQSGSQLDMNFLRKHGF